MKLQFVFNYDYQHTIVVNTRDVLDIETLNAIECEVEDKIQDLKDSGCDIDLYEIVDEIVSKYAVIEYVPFDYTFYITAY